MIGGSPCTHWSIAQSKNRETEAEGLGWELFRNFLIAKEKFRPDFFLYENNKSAAQPIKEQIAFELDAPLQYINSALVSAQNRQRFYCHNFGGVPQPIDRGILLYDILESGTSWTDKSYALTTRCVGAIPEDTLKKHRHTMVAEQIPLNLTIDEKAKCVRASCYKDGIRNLVGNDVDKRTCIAQPIQIGEINGGGQGNRIYSVDGKSITIAAQSGGAGSNTGLYAQPIKTLSEREVDYMFRKKGRTEYGYIQNADNDKAKCITANISKGVPYNVMFERADGKLTPIYLVVNGIITIKDKQYPIKLPDGYYIIRKLTVTECCRLQTMPDDYCRVVSNAQAYKGLGNGWMAEVIIHLLSHALKHIPKDEEIVVLSMYDGIGTGRYCFDKLGYKNIKYYAYEIDKYAMQISASNYSDIIQCGDAFSVREDNGLLKNYASLLAVGL